MSGKSMWLSEYRWRKLPRGLRNRLLSMLPKSSMVGSYVCNIQSALNAQGWPEVGHDLQAELEAQVEETRTGEYINTSWRNAARDWPNE